MSDAPSWISHLGLTAAIAIVPFLAIACTSFAKVAIVLGITRNALGSSGILPTSVVTALAVVVSIFIMAPVATDVIAAVENTPLADADAGDTLGITRVKQLAGAAAVPVEEFLRRNTPSGQLDYFSDLAGEDRGGPPSFRVLIAAFTSSELVEALMMGILILLPFVVVDLVVANILGAAGLFTTPPAVVALPLKLLLFVSADGWHLIVSGLVMSYGG